MADEIDELYALPLEEFTAARNDLAKRLRARGEKYEAARVAKLRKPTAPAWAIDQVARASRKKLERLLEAGEKLRDAQRALLKGGDAAEMREAVTSEREIVAELTDEAMRALEEGGHATTAAYRERIKDTFSAIAVDADLHEDALAGRLTEEHRRVGFGEIPDLKLVPPLKETRKAEREEKKRLEEEERRKDAEARAQRLNAEADELDDEAEELERKAALARRKAATLRGRADDALRAHTKKD